MLIVLIVLKFFSDATVNFRVRFSDIGETIPYDGVPFMVLSLYERCCLFGLDKHSAEKKRKDEIRERELKVCLLTLNYGCLYLS